MHSIYEKNITNCAFVCEYIYLHHWTSMQKVKNKSVATMGYGLPSKCIVALDKTNANTTPHHTQPMNEINKNWWWLFCLFIYFERYRSIIWLQSKKKKWGKMRALRIMYEENENQLWRFLFFRCQFIIVNLLFIWIKYRV